MHVIINHAFIEFLYSFASLVDWIPDSLDHVDYFTHFVHVDALYPSSGRYYATHAWQEY
jgi:hypothetical protein